MKCGNCYSYLARASTYTYQDVVAACKQHESAKKREYNQEGAKCGAWSVHTSRLHHHRQHGQRRNHLLQTPGGHALTQTRETLLRGNGLA